jgi:flagellar biosynthetic protein FlhB
VADPSKTESATPRKREDARKKGQVARSTELNTALSVLGLLLVLNLCSHYMLQELDKIAKYTWGGLDSFRLSNTELRRHALTFGLELLLVLGPVMLGALVIGVGSNLLQVGFLFAPEAMSLKWDNLSPVKGWERIFSRRTAVELGKGLLKIVVLGFTAWMTVSGQLDKLMALMNTDLGLFFSALGALAGSLMLRTGLVMLAMGLADYFYQRWEYEENLKMTKQEVKDEFRQSEGDPLIKARIRRLQQEAARRRMFAELPNADVVITNPVHLACALKYDGTSMDAPLLLAKGARLMAARIKAIAKENGIPIVENKPLARAIYASTAVGAPVSSQFFAAVAEVLALVYQAQGRLERKALENQRRLEAKRWQRTLGPQAGPDQETASPAL